MKTQANQTNTFPKSLPPSICMIDIIGLFLAFDSIDVSILVFFRGTTLPSQSSNRINTPFLLKSEMPTKGHANPSLLPLFCHSPSAKKMKGKNSLASSDILFTKCIWSIFDRENFERS